MDEEYGACVGTGTNGRGAWGCGFSWEKTICQIFIIKEFCGTAISSVHSENNNHHYMTGKIKKRRIPVSERQLNEVVKRVVRYVLCEGEEDDVAWMHRMIEAVSGTGRWPDGEWLSYARMEFEAKGDERHRCVLDSVGLYTDDLMGRRNPRYCIECWDADKVWPPDEDEPFGGTGAYVVLDFDKDFSEGQKRAFAAKFRAEWDKRFEKLVGEE